MNLPFTLLKPEGGPVLGVDPTQAAQPASSKPLTLPLSSLEAIDPDSFDWASYTSTYKGRALITRLCHITNLILDNSNPSPHALKLARAAAIRAIPLVKENTWDHTTYLRLVGQIDKTLHVGKTRAADEAMDVDAAYGKKGTEAEGKPDEVWVEETRAKEEAESSRLNVELNGYLSNLIKESIRLTYMAQADLLLKTGSLPEALKAFQQVREYSSGPAHHVELGLAIIEGSLQYNESGPVSGNATKVEASLDRLHPPTTGKGPVSDTMTRAQVEQSREQANRSAEVRRSVGVKLRVARGLLGLAHGEYSRAARELAEAAEEGGLQDWDGAVISTSDLAFITAICALASGSRDYVNRIILDRPSFHSSVDDSQSWILDLVRKFVGAHYGEALEILRKAEPYMLLNPFLARHTSDLLQKIRQRALVQYVEPFSSVRISQMASAFETDEAAMVIEVSQLAEGEHIKARIDLVDRLIHIKSPDPRAEAFRSALEGGAKITAQTQANVARMRLKEAGVVVDFGEEDGGSGNRPSVPKGPGPQKSRGLKEWGSRLKSGWGA